MIFKRIFIFTALFFISCSTLFKESNDNNAVPAENVKHANMRYVNMSLIFDYIVKTDPDARRVKDKKDSLIKALDETEALPEADRHKTAQLKKELKDLLSDEAAQKSRVLNSIDSVLSKYAKKSEIDYIFNYGEGVVYAGKEYDITEEILHEIMKQKSLDAPASR